MFLCDSLLTIPRYLALKLCIYYPGIKLLWVVLEMESEKWKTVVKCSRRPRNGKVDERTRTAMYTNEKMLNMQICDALFAVVVVSALAPTAATAKMSLQSRTWQSMKCFAIIPCWSRCTKWVKCPFNWFTACSRCRQNLTFENFTWSFGRLRQKKKKKMQQRACSTICKPFSRISYITRTLSCLPPYRIYHGSSS